MGYIHKLLGLVSILKIGNDPPVLMSWFYLETWIYHFFSKTAIWQHGQVALSWS